MLLKTRLEVGTVGAHSLWLILIGIVIISPEPARSHAPPRSIYYGHRVEAREPFKHMPTTLVFGDSTSARDDRLYAMPTCSQLKNMWKNSMRSLNKNVLINDNYLDSNQIPLVLNNPYYMAFLWQQSIQNSRPHFGKIVSEPTVTTSAPTRDVRPHHHSGKDFTSPKNSLKAEVPQIPGHFMDEPSPVGVVYGHVIHSPDESEDRHRLRSENGVFGDFVPQADDRIQMNGISSEKNNNKNVKQSSSSKQQRTGSNANTFSTAEEFFKSGVWHEKPVIPSVSFQRFH